MTDSLSLAVHAFDSRVRQLHKNAASNIEQVLEVAPTKL